MKQKNYEPHTYYLFGAKAIQIYQFSVFQLIHTNNIFYNVGRYNTVKDFMAEKNKWNAFIEINLKDYLKIQKHLTNKPTITINPNFNISSTYI